MDIQKKSIKNHIYKFNTNVSESKYEPDIIDFDGKHYAIKGNLYQRIKLKVRVFAYKMKVKSTNKVKIIALNKLIKLLDMKANRFLQRIAKGENFIGKVIFAFLDIIPLPNFHEIMKQVNKEYPEAPILKKIQLLFQKIDWTRTLTALIGAALIVLEYIEPGTLILLLQ